MPSVRLAALAVVLTGLATIVMAIVLTVVPGTMPSPATLDHPAKFTNTILWFELVNDVDEVFAVLGPFDDSVGVERREKLDRVNQLDFGFMVAYSAFNGALVILVWSLNRGRRFWNGLSLVGAGAILAALMLVGDVIENLQLLQLTGYDTANDISADVMRQLNVWTRVKWGALFAESVLLAWGYAVYFLRTTESRGQWSGLIVALCFAAAAVVGFPSLMVDSIRYWLEFASLCLFPAWLISLFHAGFLLLKLKRS